MPDTGSTTYGNIIVSWLADSSAIELHVSITSGGAPIGDMTFTPNTLTNTLTYSNPPQSASGKFLAEFAADMLSGRLLCENFKWKLPSGSGGPITEMVGMWLID